MARPRQQSGAGLIGWNSWFGWFRFISVLGAVQRLAQRRDCGSQLDATGTFCLFFGLDGLPSDAQPGRQVGLAMREGLSKKPRDSPASVARFGRASPTHAASARTRASAPQIGPADARSSRSWAWAQRPSARARPTLARLRPLSRRNAHTDGHGLVGIAERHARAVASKQFGICASARAIWHWCAARSRRDREFAPDACRPRSLPALRKFRQFRQNFRGRSPPLPASCRLARPARGSRTALSASACTASAPASALGLDAGRHGPDHRT